jgi:hypothetical protein
LVHVSTELDGARSLPFNNSLGVRQRPAVRLFSVRGPRWATVDLESTIMLNDSRNIWRVFETDPETL